MEDSSSFEERLIRRLESAAPVPPAASPPPAPAASPPAAAVPPPLDAPPSSLAWLFPVGMVVALAVLCAPEAPKKIK
jgi:hypothetical protein